MTDHRTYQPKITIRNGLPTTFDGTEGSFTLRKLSKGLFLFIYYSNKWWKITQVTDFIGDGSTNIKNTTQSAAMANEAFSNLTINGNTKINPKAATSDTDKFLVSDNKEVKYRTGAQLLSDVSVASSTTVSGVVELATTAETTTGTDTARAITPDGLKDGYEGSVNIETVGDLDAGAITSGFGEIDNGASAITTTGTISGGIINGSVAWQEFPFGTSAQTAIRVYYMRDNDDYDDFRKWDDYDTNMVLNYRKIHGHYVVPEDCTLTYMRGIIANQGSTADPTLNVWYCLQTNIATDTGDTTFSKAGSDETVSIGTLRVGHQFNEVYDVDLTAGSIVIPTIRHSDASSQSYTGSLTLKFITR